MEFEPKRWTELDFWEHYFDRDPDAVAAFEEELRRMTEGRAAEAQTPLASP